MNWSSILLAISLALYSALLGIVWLKKVSVVPSCFGYCSNRTSSSFSNISVLIPVFCSKKSTYPFLVCKDGLEQNGPSQSLDWIRTALAWNCRLQQFLRLNSIFLFIHSTFTGANLEPKRILADKMSQLFFTFVFMNSLLDEGRTASFWQKIFTPSKGKDFIQAKRHTLSGWEVAT